MGARALPPDTEADAERSPTATGMTIAQTIRLHRFHPTSRANGPGVRAVVWVQGCSLACPGCYNPETHAHAGGDGEIAVASLANRILALGDAIAGVTVSGGEPLQQLPAVDALLGALRARSSLSTVLFSGFAIDEIARLPGAASLLGRLDVLIAGRYDPSQRLASGLRGSANKVAHFLTERYAQADLDRVPDAEVIVMADGQIALSGIDPLLW